MCTKLMFKALLGKLRTQINILGHIQRYFVKFKYGIYLGRVGLIERFSNYVIKL